VKDAIRVAIAARTPLSEAITKVLAEVPGIILVDDPALADAVVTAPTVAAAMDEPLLTAREREVLALLAEGASNKAIAEALGISARTAKFHVSQIIDKLDAIGRTDAVAQAARIGVIRL
jgi:DNA-binding CsgD family transcriptional regulator